MTKTIEQLEVELEQSEQRLEVLNSKERKLEDLYNKATTDRTAEEHQYDDLNNELKKLKGLI